MERLQVLVATMGQQDMSLVRKMNIRCSAVIANQADREEIAIEGNVKMVTTATRGVGLNRNIAILAADSELVLFADDDVVYKDDMPEQVVKAFDENPQADVLIFGMDIVKDGKVREKRHLKSRRLRVWNSMRFGTYTIAARRLSLVRHSIMFHRYFGGGCPFSSGEDSLLIKSCFDHRLKVYSHTYVLGTCCKDTSSWFRGYNEKYFYDKGVLMRCLFPRTPWIMALYFAINFKRKTDLGVFQRIKWMHAGVLGGKRMITYQEHYEENHHR